MKTQKCHKEKNLKSGFTLLELLVVVLIIGILAGIALPQYNFSVAKSKYSTLKTLTKNITDAVNRYYLLNNDYPKSYKDLDIDLSLIYHEDGTNFYFNIQGDISCQVWGDTNQMTACYREIAQKKVGYYFSLKKQKPLYCYVNSRNTSDNANKFCQKETYKNESHALCNANYCLYGY